jgi:hypothetical protein
MKAAEELLEGDASLIAMVEGYYSMLHKANEALARDFKIGHTNAHYSVSEGYSRHPAWRRNYRKQWTKE